jgi:hypothetical protein
MCAHQPYPLYPLPLIKGEGEDYFFKRGEAPLKHPNRSSSIKKELTFWELYPSKTLAYFAPV